MHAPAAGACAGQLTHEHANQPAAAVACAGRLHVGVLQRQLPYVRHEQAPGLWGDAAIELGREDGLVCVVGQQDLSPRAFAAFLEL